MLRIIFLILSISSLTISGISGFIRLYRNKKWDKHLVMTESISRIAFGIFIICGMLASGTYQNLFNLIVVIVVSMLNTFHGIATWISFIDYCGLQEYKARFEPIETSFTVQDFSEEPTKPVIMQLPDKEK